MFWKIVPVVILAIISTGVLADVAHLSSTRAALLQKIHHKQRHHKHHHKRGVFAGVPPYKLGYDIPVVSHSVIKPLLVSYPTRAVPIGVKIPLKNPYELKYPLPVGHAVPVPHHGFGLKFPGWHKPLLLPAVPIKEQHDFHDHHIHHHHVTPLAHAPVVSVAAPAVPVPAAVPVQAPVFPVPVAQPSPNPPPPSVHFHPAPSVPVPTLVSFAPLPVRPAFPVAVQSSPLIPAPPPPLYHIRPGNSVQASYFATYPRFPLVAPPQPIGVPFGISQAVPIGVPTGAPLGLPTGVPVGVQGPHFHVVPQPHVPELIPHQHPTQVVPLQPSGSGFVPGVAQQTHPGVFVQQPPVATDGWNPITSTAPTFHPQATQITPAHGYPAQTPSHHFTEGHAQVYENAHEHNYHQLEHEHQLNLHQFDQHQQQLEQHNVQQQQFEQHQAEQNQLQQQFEQHQAEQHNYQQQLEQHKAEQHQLAHQEHQYQQQQVNQEYGAPQHDYNAPQQQLNLEYGAPQQHGQEYGVPQHQERLDGNEGRGYQEDNNQQEDSGQRWHNHIPLGLQLPLQRPLDDFH